MSETLASRQTVFSGALLTVHRDVVRLSDGGEAVREWVHHPGAAAVVPVFEDGSTLLVRQFRYATGREFLEVPAGKSILDALIDAGLNPDHSCKEGVCGACETAVLGGEVDHHDGILSKAERAADLACRFSVSEAPVMFAACIAASRLLWMMPKASA